MQNKLIFLLLQSLLQVINILSIYFSLCSVENRFEILELYLKIILVLLLVKPCTY